MQEAESGACIEEQEEGLRQGVDTVEEGEEGEVVEVEVRKCNIIMLQVCMAAIPFK